MTTEEERYYALFELVRTDLVTNEEMQEYTELCQKLFIELLEDNKDIFLRLKNI